MFLGKLLVLLLHRTYSNGIEQSMGRTPGRKEEEEPPGRGEATDAANGGQMSASQTESRCEISALVK